MAGPVVYELSRLTYSIVVYSVYRYNVWQYMLVYSYQIQKETCICYIVITLKPRSVRPACKVVSASDEVG